MKLPKASYTWALRHLTTEGDSDLFPRPIELAALRFQQKAGVVNNLADLDLAEYRWRGGRRMLVPKDLLSFRLGTQLDPLDSVVLTAVVKKVGAKLERHRISPAEHRVFSYRFNPTADGRFYGTETGWRAFWERSREYALRLDCTHVLVADISDFYNQIYHHVVENQLTDAGLAQPELHIFKGFLKAYSETVSRGVPIGPHSVHLLAELALHPIDQALLANGHAFCRYVDDFHIFCGSENDAHSALYDLANCLDEQQRLTLSKPKTRVLTASAFIDRASSMLLDRPINDHESAVLAVISNHVGDDPYAQIALSDLDGPDLERLDGDTLSALLHAYLDAEPTDYSRIGWLLRRLRQVGAPGAIDFVVENLERFAPVLGDVARYIMAAARNYVGDHTRLGDGIVRHLSTAIVAKSPYLQLVLLDVLATVPALDHAEAVTARYDSASPQVRREILRVAAAHGLGSWLRGRKHEFRTMDPWSRPAYLAGLPALPGDEAKHWLREIRVHLTPMERIVVRYAFSDRDMQVGDTKLREIR